MDYFCNSINLPNLNEPLVGRQTELATLDEKLGAGGCLAITGVGGQGKTALAWAYFKKSYDEVGFAKPIWHTVQRGGADSALTTIATYLEINLAGQSPEQTAEQVRYKLSQQPRLLVLDNFEDALTEGGELSPDLAALWPKITGQNGSSRVLITTRDLPNLAKQYRPEILKLKGWSEADGLAYLQRRKLADQPEQLLRAVRKAEGNPFALNLVANLVEGGDALTDLVNDGDSWDFELQAEPRLLVKSWDRLHDHEREVLKVLAVLRPPISPELLEYLLQPPTLPAQTPRERRELLRRLEHDLGLISSPGYQLHTLFRRFVLDKKLIVGEAEILAWTAALYYQFEEMPHLKPHQNYGRKNIEDGRAVVEAVLYFNAAGFYRSAFALFFYENLHEDLLRWGQSTYLLNIYTEWSETETFPDKNELFGIFGNLGITYYALGQYGKAIEIIDKALIFVQTNHDKMNECIFLGNLGSIYEALGQYGESIKYSNLALGIACEIKNRKLEGANLGNLGLAYRGLGNYNKAIEFLTEALNISRKLKNRQIQGNNLNNIGIVFQHLEKYDEAISFHVQALEIAREIGDKRGECSRVGNLSSIYTELGQYDMAVEYSELTKKIAGEIGDRRSEGTSWGNLGNIHLYLKRYDEAIEFLNHAFIIAREIGDKEGQGRHLCNFGLAYKAKGNIDQARKKWQAALQILEEIKSPNAEKVRKWLEETKLPNLDTE